MARTAAPVVSASLRWLALALALPPVLCAAEDQGFMASAHSAKAHLTDYMHSMKGFKERAKQAFCGAMPVEALCGKSAAGASTAACTGPACCAKSSCYSGSLPGLRCDADRGATTCVGSKLFVGKGVCKCSSGVCGASGHCTTNAAATPGFSSLYEEGAVVPPEDFTGPLLLGLGVVTAGLVVGCAAVVRRSGRRAGSFRHGGRVDSEGLMEDAGECVE